MSNSSERQAQSRKRQHAVPKFYLDRFSDGSGYVSAYDKIIGRHHERISTKNVAVESDFYTLESVAPEDIYALEEALAVLEAEGSAAMRDVVAHRTVEFGDQPTRQRTKTILSLYIRAQILRSHKFRDHVVETGNEYYRSAGVENLFEDGPPPWFRDEVRYYEMLLPYLGGLIKFDDNRDQVLGVLFGTAEELTARLVTDFRWIVVNNPNHSNITSDMPVGCLSIDDVDGDLWSLGLDNIANIWLPIDPEFALLLTKARKDQSGYLVGRPEPLERWNQILRQRAYRWVIWRGGTAADQIDLRNLSRTNPLRS